MFCVKCGVELADSERKCPLCGTPVYFPGLDPNPERSYPAENKPKEKINLQGFSLIVTILCVIVGGVVFSLDIFFAHNRGWSLYFIGGMSVVYTTFIFPGWFPRPRPTLFAFIDFVTAALFTGFINLAVRGDWFLTFALPLTAFVAFIICLNVFIRSHSKRNFPYSIGASFILTAAALVPFELLVDWNFLDVIAVNWSIYPAVACFLVGSLIISAGLIPSLRDYFKRVFML